MIRQIVIACAELTFNAGIMDSVSANFPENVQANWEERLEAIRDWALIQTEEIQSFAESWD